MKISARMGVDVDAVVESYPIVEIFAMRSRKSEEPEPTSTVEERVLSETLNVSLIGKVHNGTIGDFQVTAVQVDR